MKNENEIKQEKERIIKFIETLKIAKKKGNAVQKQKLDLRISEFMTAVEMLDWVLNDS